jgi:hypothetical protein
MSHKTATRIPVKLVYKGQEYHIAVTEESRLWETQLAPRLEALAEIAANKELSDHVKKEQARTVYYELREYFKLLGIQ